MATAVRDRDELLGDLIGEAETAVREEHGDVALAAATGTWREQPVDFDEFVLGRDHLNLPELFPRQREAVVQLLGLEPERIFEAPDAAGRIARAFQVAVLLWGKGSGKDYLSSVVVTYLVYLLLCLADPQGYFGLAPGEPIDVINVAYNADQAKRVFFEKLKQRLFRWRWLRENYDIHEAGRRKYKDAKGRPVIEINDQEVLFPRQIRCFSKHSQNESYEGLNIIAWVMDEASAFLSAAKKENAGKIYQTLRTSAASRFGMRWVGFIISYPRHADDFTMEKVAEAHRHPQAGLYADGPAKTWEVNLMRGQQGMVEIRPGHQVPIELANDYTLDFEEALAKYECMPPLAKDALIKDADRVWAAVRKGKAPLIEWEPRITSRDVVTGEGEEVQRSFAAVKLTKLGKLPKGCKLFAHGDPARSSDGFALALGHGVPHTVMLHVPASEVLTTQQMADAGLQGDELVPWERDVTKTVIDALIVWRPDPKFNRHVDLVNVKDVIQQIVAHYGNGVFGGWTFDHYDSAELVQWMQTKRVPGVENEQWSNPFQHRIYRGARSCFYNDLVELPDTPTITSTDRKEPGAIYELVRVEEIEGHKIDHPEGGSKDLADAVVRVIEHVSGQVRKAFSFGSVGAQNHQGAQLTGGSRKVDPKRTRKLADDPALAHQEASRQELRPEGDLTPAIGEVSAPKTKFSFGSTRR